MSNILVTGLGSLYPGYTGYRGEKDKQGLLEAAMQDECLLALYFLELKACD